jgi:alanine-synthesizing transaminase
MTDNWHIELPSRIRRLPPYVFARVNALRDRKRQEGVDVIDLGMGSPHDPPPAEVIDKMCEVLRDPRIHGYSQSIGIPNLRREVAKMYKRRYGVTLDPASEIIATVGSKEGFSHMCLALIGPGDTAVVGDPYFPIHVYGIALAGGGAINVPLGNDQAFLDRVANVVDHMFPKPKLLILNYPHNPTAMTVDSVEFFDHAVDLARRTGMMIIHDFAYGQTVFDDYVAPSFLQAKGAKDVGVEFLTMSKPYSMAGWRIGFCVGNAEMIRALATIKGYYDYGIFQPIQIAAIVAMRHCDAAVESVAAEYQQRRDVLCDGLERSGWEVEIPKAGMFVWAKIPEPWAQMGSIDFSMMLLDKGGVAVSPGRGFGEDGEGYLRLAIVENSQRLRQAVREIGRCTKADQAKAS